MSNTVEEKKIDNLFVSNVKELPRDSETGKILQYFEANGNKYKILSSEDGISINRWLRFKKYGFEMAAGMSMNSLYKKMYDYENLLKSGASVYELSVSFAEMNKSVINLSKERFDKALWYCTTFIIKEGEDVTTYNVADAEEKMHDWAVEGYNIFDFFFLAVNSDKTLATEFARLSKEATATIPDDYLVAYQDYTMLRKAKQKVNL